MIQKWEYCLLDGISVTGGGLDTAYPSLIRFTQDGCEYKLLSRKEPSERPDMWKRAEDREYVGHVIANLGIDGWEMVGAGGGKGIFFRRPLINEVS